MVVTIAYSVLQPIINGLACFIFFLLFQLYKYLFLYQFDQPAATDTGGLFFPKAITQVFVGLYVEQICLCALFFLQQDLQGKLSCIPEAALMIVLIVITAGFHLILNDSYGPLLNALPLSLVDRASQDDVNNGDSRESIEDEGAPLREKGVNNGTTTGAELSTTRSDSIRRKPAPSAATKVEEHELVARRRRADDGSNRTTNGDSSSPALNGGESEERYAGLRDFTHPALQPARIIWLPEDTLGLNVEEVKDIRARGIEVTTRGAYMNEKGTVDVDTYPPGEKPFDGPGLSPSS